MSHFPSHRTCVIQRFRQDWSVVSTNSALIADTFLRAVTRSPVRYSPKCRRSGALAKRPPNSATASSTTVGKSTIPGMNNLSHGQGKRKRGMPSSYQTYQVPSSSRYPLSLTDYPRNSAFCKSPVIIQTPRPGFGGAFSLGMNLLTHLIPLFDCRNWCTKRKRREPLLGGNFPIQQSLSLRCMMPQLNLLSNFLKQKYLRN